MISILYKETYFPSEVVIYLFLFLLYDKGSKNVYDDIHVVYLLYNLNDKEEIMEIFVTDNTFKCYNGTIKNCLFLKICLLMI